MAAGVTGGAGVALLYRALAVGTMAIVAPTTAVCAVAVPVFASIALGERPSMASRRSASRSWAAAWTCWPTRST
jgi:uncharacterized membrane protein